MGVERCPMPRCSMQAASEILLDDFQGSNLQVHLCSEHADLYQAGRIPEEMLISLAGFREQEVQESSNKLLSSRSMYLDGIVKKLNNFQGTLYITYVGPLPFHPNWYHSIRDMATGLPNMDKIVRNILIECSKGAGYDIKIIFRNSSRYIEKVREMTPPCLMSRLRDDILASIDEILGSGSTPPLFCCSEFSHVHIPTIFEDGAVAAVRETSNTPIDSGMLITEPSILQWEKNSFNRIFTGAHRGAHSELNDLKNFISSALI